MEIKKCTSITSKRHIALTPDSCLIHDIDTLISETPISIELKTPIIADVVISRERLDFGAALPNQLTITINY